MQLLSHGGMSSVERDGLGSSAMEESACGSDGDWVKVESSSSSGGCDDGELLNVEFFEPAGNWNEALPLGNGKLGAMVFGGVSKDVVMLNDDTLYTGGPKNWNNPRAKEILPRVREAVFAGLYEKATNLAGKMLGPYCQPYQPLGSLTLQFDGSHAGFDPESYHRYLDLDTATASVKYDVGGIKYTRQYLTSQPHQVLVVKITADQEASVSFSVSLSSPLQESVGVPSQNRLLITGSAPGDVEEGVAVGKGMSFAVVAEIQLSKGRGSVQANGDQSLRVSDADWAIIVLTSSTSFAGPFKSPVLSENDSPGNTPSEQALATISGVSNLSYKDLVTAHLLDYQPLFRRVTLHLAGSSERKFNFQDSRTSELQTGNTAFQLGQEGESSGIELSVKRKGKRQLCGPTKKISTRDRIKSFQADQDPQLVTLLFQFGRYLLLASSRPGTFVANLQGIWNKDLSPAWRCVPHININLPMNYWPAETCNLAECHGPLFETIDTMAFNGRITALVNYGLDGWVGHHNVDIWGQTAPVGGDPVWALWPMGGAWLCLHMWDHYCFSLDEAFLKTRAYPTLKECARFLVGWIIEDEEGTLITNPSTSPEHYFVCPGSRTWASVAYSAAMDLTIVGHLFKAVIEADQILGNVDVEFTSGLKDLLQRLCPVKLSHDGCIMEWGREFEDPEATHRHMSHLFGVFPGNSITPGKTPEFCQAAVKSILKRGEIGPGWSTAWKIALWSRLWNADHAYKMILRMFNLIEADETVVTAGGLYGNLFNAYPPFQIDGNLGFTGALAELFLQSDGEALYLCLPCRRRYGLAGR